MANEFRRSVQDFAAGLGLIALTLLIFGLTQFDAQNPAAASAFQVPDPEQQQAKGETYVVKTIPPLSIDGASVPPRPKNDPKPASHQAPQYSEVANFGDNVKVFRKDSGALCLELTNQTTPIYLVQRNADQIYLTDDAGFLEELQKTTASVTSVPAAPIPKSVIQDFFTTPPPAWQSNIFFATVLVFAVAYLVFNLYKIKQTLLAMSQELEEVPVRQR